MILPTPTHNPSRSLEVNHNMWGERTVLKPKKVRAIAQKKVPAGDILLSSNNGARPGLDYALVRVRDYPGWKNTMALRRHNVERLVDICLANSSSLWLDSQDVVACTASKGLVTGKLLAAPSLFRLPGGRNFQDVFLVWLDDFLSEGDCGAAVLEPDTGRFYGHIVAGTPGTGLAYIIEADQIFRDIDARVGQSSVTLQSTAAGDKRFGPSSISAEELTNRERLELRWSQSNEGSLSGKTHLWVYSDSDNRFLRIDETTESDIGVPQKKVERIFSLKNLKVVPFYTITEGGQGQRQRGFRILDPHGFSSLDLDMGSLAGSEAQLSKFQALVTGYRIRSRIVNITCFIPSQTRTRYRATKTTSSGEAQFWIPSSRHNVDTQESSSSTNFSQDAGRPSTGILGRILRAKSEQPALLLFLQGRTHYDMLKLDLMEVRSAITKTAVNLTPASRYFHLDKLSVQKSDPLGWNICAMGVFQSSKDTVKLKVSSLCIELGDNKRAMDFEQQLLKEQLLQKGIYRERSTTAITGTY
ncbi:hypothetical protein B0H63DRAFT_184100 [Podospora didyma]|uniref:Uncharacterized protein n=1 Tax=Podospora didyma TaxID=330526 RepID=A0AAE0TZW2_9PEZI|nr:hypothetical protein B0H63DRAFT_184100 [Podospora didyma]